jgi:electron transfer flavoprotein alpha subunit
MSRIKTKETSDFSSYKGVWVLAEQQDSCLKSVGLELLSIGRKLADIINEELVAVLLGKNVEALANELATYGTDKVVVVEHNILEQYSIDGYTTVLTKLSQKLKPSILLVGGSLNGRELAPRLAARLEAGITADCTGLDIDEKGQLLQIRPTFGGKLMATILCPRTRPQMASVRPNVFKKPERDITKRAKIVRVKVDIPIGEVRTKVLKVIKKVQTYGDIENAEKIISVGRGIGSKDNLKMIYELADTLGASVAGSRPVIEKGWLPTVQQVGQSGKTVSPKLYIAVGISGAIQHLVGMQSSDLIIAINKDPKASIFQVATYGLVGDLFEIIPLLTEAFKKELKK